MIQKLKELIEAATSTPLSFSPQHGPPGHCMLAQVWNEVGDSVAQIEPTEKPECASATAELFVFLVNHSEDFVRMAEEASFLVDRLTDFENSSDNLTEDGVSDYHGHVAPSLSRLRKALAALSGEKQ